MSEWPFILTVTPLFPLSMSESLIYNNIRAGFLPLYDSFFLHYIPAMFDKFNKENLCIFIKTIKFPKVYYCTILKERGG